MADSAGNWCLIESDPGVFSELIREFGMCVLKIENYAKTGNGIHCFGFSFFCRM